MSKNPKITSSPKEVARLKEVQSELQGFVDFVGTTAYKKHLQPRLEAWVAEANSILSKLESTPAQLKEAQLRLYYANEVQKVFTHQLEIFLRNNTKISEATGEA